MLYCTYTHNTRRQDGIALLALGCLFCFPLFSDDGGREQRARRICPALQDQRLRYRTD